MNSYTRKFSLESAISPTMTSVNSAAATELSDEITDTRQEKPVQTTYALSPYLETLDLKVTMNGGVGTLTGKPSEGVLPRHGQFAA